MPEYPPDKPLDFENIDRSAFEVYTLGEEPNDVYFWMSRTPTERFIALEVLRQMNYGYEDPTTPRLQRVLEVETRDNEQTQPNSEPESHPLG